MSFDTSVVGRAYEGPEFAVDRERIAAYAAATNDASPSAASGEIAPPVFHFVPLRPVLRAMLKDVTPLYEELRGLHGEQDIRVARPLRPGDVLVPTGTIVGIRPRATGTAVVGHAQTHARDGGLVSEHYITLYFPGAFADEPVGEDAPGHRLPDEAAAREPDARVDQRTDVDQPVRYAEASGDTGRYHLDADAARAVGLPGIIMHGMCTMALAGSAVVGEVAGGDVERLRRLAVRLSRPVIPGQRLETRIWRLGSNGAEAFGFETVNEDGERVLAHGRAEVA